MISGMLMEIMVVSDEVEDLQKVAFDPPSKLIAFLTPRSNIIFWSSGTVAF